MKDISPRLNAARRQIRHHWSGLNQSAPSSVAFSIGLQGGPRTPVNDLGLVHSLDRFGQRVVVRTSTLPTDGSTSASASRSV